MIAFKIIVYETAVSLTKGEAGNELEFTVSAYRNVCPNKEEIAIEACMQLWGMKGLG